MDSSRILADARMKNGAAVWVKATGYSEVEILSSMAVSSWGTRRTTRVVDGIIADAGAEEKHLPPPRPGRGGRCQPHHYIYKSALNLMNRQRKTLLRKIDHPKTEPGCLDTASEREQEDGSASAVT